MPPKRKVTREPEEEMSHKVLCVDSDMLNQWSGLFADKDVKTTMEQRFGRLVQLDLGAISMFPVMPCVTTTGVTLKTACYNDADVYAFSFYNSDSPKPVIHNVLGKIILFAGCAWQNNVYQHFLIPVMRYQGIVYIEDTLLQYLVMPPLDDVPDLMISSAEVNLDLYVELTTRYMARLNKAKIVKNKAPTVNINEHNFCLATVACGDGVFNHVTYFEVLSNTTEQTQAVVTGSLALFDALKMAKTQPLYRAMSLHRLSPTVTEVEAKALYAQFLAAPQAPPAVESRPIARVKPNKVSDELEAQNAQLKLQIAELTDTNTALQAASFAKKKDLLDAILAEMKTEKPDVARFIKLNMLCMDDDAEVANWQARCDVLVERTEAYKKMIQIYAYKTFGERLEEPQLINTFKVQLESKLYEAVNTWDLATLKQKFLKMTEDWMNWHCEAELQMNLYQETLRCCEKQYRQQIAALTEMAPGTLSTAVTKAWYGLRHAMQAVSKYYDDERCEDSPLRLALAVDNLMEKTLVLAAGTDEDITKKILLGTGRDAIHLNALDFVPGALKFRSPMRSFFANMLDVPITKDLIVAPYNMRGIARIDQLMLFAAGKPFLKFGFWDDDETRQYFKQELKMQSKKLWQEHFNDSVPGTSERRWWPEAGYEGYQASLADLEVE